MDGQITADVDRGTGIFLGDGDRATGAVVRVVLPRNPDHVRERYSGDLVKPFRVATTAEIDAQVAARGEAGGDSAFDGNKPVVAALVVALWTALGHQPTTAEIATAKTRFRAIYKTLEP